MEIEHIYEKNGSVHRLIPIPERYWLYVYQVTLT